MLAHPTHERLIALGLSGMARGFEDQRRSPDIGALSFEERLGLLVDREAAERETRRLTTRLKHAALRHNASIEDVDMRTPRGLDRALFQKLVAGACSTSGSPGCSRPLPSLAATAVTAAP
jgi:DNA replication protein DnaC